MNKNKKWLTHIKIKLNALNYKNSKRISMDSDGHYK